MLKNKQEFIDYCVDACQQGTFVTGKHDITNLSTPSPKKRSVNLMGNSEMEAYLQKGDFRVDCYSDTKPGNTPQLYILTPNDSSIVSGSGVPPLSTTPTTGCDVFAVPSGQYQGWHGYACQSSDVKKQETQGRFTWQNELT